MTAIAPATLKKVANLLPSLASTYDGEKVATVLAMIRTLEAAGADLHDLVDALQKPPIERVVYRDRIVEVPQSTVQGAPDTAWDYRDVIKIVGSILEPHNNSDLNEKEEAFLTNMRLGARRHKAKFRITEKQGEWLRRLAKEHLGLEVG